MAIPITPQDTQKNCAPVSSNCVIWQGPDIPLIGLCRGDSISDVTAKLAAELTTLVEQLDITGFDVSCFPPICPKPENIHDLIQFILDTLCAGNTGSGTSTNFTCDDVKACEFPIATCFQYTDNFGNNITTMTLSDYAQAIAVKVCGITTQISTINNTLTDHETRLETLEACVLPCNTDPIQPTVPASECILPTSTDIPIVTFIEEFEAQFCTLRGKTGTPTEIDTSVGLICDNLAASPSLNDPISYPTMSVIPGWTPSPDSLAESMGNLWLTVCDMRDAFMSLKTTVEACCGVSCSDNTLSLSGVMTGRLTANLTLSGGINSAFQFCAGTSGTIKVTDPWGAVVTMTTSEDIISDINNNTPYLMDFSTAPGSAAEKLVVYNVKVEACLTTADGSVTCSINESTLFQNNTFLQSPTDYTISSPAGGEFSISISNMHDNTSYVFYLKNAANPAVIVDTYNTGIIPTTGSVITKVFTGLNSGQTYYCSVTASQNLYTISCQDTQSQLIS